MKNELVLRARRAVCPGSGRDGAATFFIADGHIVKVVDQWLGDASLHTISDSDEFRLIDVEGAVLTPGLVDLHAHVDLTRQSRYGVSPDSDLLPSGTTTVGSQGDVGADGIVNFQSQTIAKSKTRVRLAINLSQVGETLSVGAFCDRRNADVDACISAIEKHRDSVWAIAVNLSHHSCGATPPQLVLNKARDAAQRAHLPLLVGLRRPEDWPLADQLELLHSGDVVTYCFRRTPHCLVEASTADQFSSGTAPSEGSVLSGGSVLPEFLDARQRGVLFDVGHGRGSFDFRTAEIAIEAGFPPDTISSDFQIGHLDESHPHGLLQVMAKLQAAGMSWEAALAASTFRPAQLLSLSNETPAFGELTVGSSADFVALADSTTATKLWDTSGYSRPAPLQMVKLVVCQGEVIVER
jgi:dihydroorotase